MASEVSGDRLIDEQFDPMADLVCSEDMLEADYPARNALTASQALLAFTLERLEAERKGAHTEQAVEECHLKEAALWYCHAEAERLRFGRAITIIGETATIKDEERHQHMHTVRDSLTSAALAAQNSHNPDAQKRLEYLICRTLGIVEMANALTTPPFNQATRQFFRARSPLLQADYVLTHFGLAPDHEVSRHFLAGDQARQKMENRAHDPHLSELFALLERAEYGNPTYLEAIQPAKKSIVAIIGLAAPKSRTTERHILQHPAFTCPAPHRASALLLAA